VGVLTAIFSNSRRVSLDIAWILLRTIKRGGEELNELSVLIDEVFADRLHRLLRSLSIPCTTDNGPGLSKTVDLTLLVALTSKGRTIIEEGPAVPFSIPGVPLGGVPQPLCALTERNRSLVIPLSFKEGGKVFNNLDLEPREPYALSSPVSADLIHAVVPVSTTDEGESVLTDS
jgi:hypothetical protein